jgi:hypothetical protein
MEHSIDYRQVNNTQNFDEQVPCIHATLKTNADVGSDGNRLVNVEQIELAQDWLRWLCFV